MAVRRHAFTTADDDDDGDGGDDGSRGDEKDFAAASTEVIAAGAGGFLNVWQWARPSLGQGCHLLLSETALHGDGADVSSLSLDAESSLLVTGSLESIRVWVLGSASLLSPAPES